LGMGCGGRGSVGRDRNRRAGRKACERTAGAQTNDVASGFAKTSSDVHRPAKPLGEDGSRTAKPCGPGIRC
jgi:hypothetical protein